MIIDTHIHESRYSSDSTMDFDDCIEHAKTIGLDGICITNHDNNYLREEIGDFKQYGELLVIVGTEILTHQGDIVVFGLKDIPKEKISAEQLLELVKKHDGAAIAAHPFRNKVRCLGDQVEKYKSMLTGVESFNGGSTLDKNLEGYRLTRKLKLPSLGSSDAHSLDKLGSFATKFYSNIRDDKDFIEALKTRNYNAVKYNNNLYEDIK